MGQARARRRAGGPGGCRSAGPRPAPPRLSAKRLAIPTLRGIADPRSRDHATAREAGIERLADAVESHLDLDHIERLLGLEHRCAASLQLEKEKS